MRSHKPLPWKIANLIQTKYLHPECYLSFQWWQLPFLSFFLWRSYGFNRSLCSLFFWAFCGADLLAVLCTIRLLSSAPSLWLQRPGLDMPMSCGTTFTKFCGNATPYHKLEFLKWPCELESPSEFVKITDSWICTPNLIDQNLWGWGPIVCFLN